MKMKHVRLPEVTHIANKNDIISIWPSDKPMIQDVIIVISMVADVIFDSRQKWFKSSEAVTGVGCRNP